jgi:hypothetical protein
MSKKPNRNIEQLTVAVVETLTPELPSKPATTDDELRADFFRRNPNASEANWLSIRDFVVRHATVTSRHA